MKTTCFSFIIEKQTPFRPRIKTWGYNWGRLLGLIAIGSIAAANILCISPPSTPAQIMREFFAIVDTTHNWERLNKITHFEKTTVEVFKADSSSPKAYTITDTFCEGDKAMVIMRYGDTRLKINLKKFGRDWKITEAYGYNIWNTEVKIWE